MKTREEILESIKPILFANMRKGSRGVNWKYIAGIPNGKNMLGTVIDHQPFKGKVVGCTEDVIVVKDRNYFYAISNLLINQIPKVGKKVEIIPYIRKKFDGKGINELVKEPTQYMDGLFLNANSCLLGCDRARIPGAEVKNPHLRELVNQLQDLYVYGHYRRITHMLADANATNFVAVDPVEGDETNPSISFDVNSSKFTGNISIAYMADSDTYSIDFTKAGEPSEESSDYFDFVHWDDLAERLAEIVDDGYWQNAQIIIH